MTALAHVIGGERRDGGEAALPNVNPATAKQIGEVPVGGAAEVDAAVRAARDAFATWRDTPGSARRKLILRLAQLVSDNASALGQMATEDMGMPLGIALGEALYSAEYLEYFAGWADKLRGSTIPLSAPKTLDYTRREPVGVVGAITPWNAPVSQVVWKLAPALAAGNCIVVKPSELAPRPGLRVVELALEAGFPPGVVSCVLGDGSTGRLLVEHPGTDRIAFTGGTATGRAIAGITGPMLKAVNLELGGKSANIVFADADLDAAAMQSAIACFLNTGQQCVAGSRLLVESSIRDAFLDTLVAAAKTVAVGDPMRFETQVGPLVSEQALRRVESFVAEARDEADVVLGGARPGGDLSDGFFYEPTILAGVRNDMRVCREEIFGPVMSVLTFDTVEEAVALANDTEYGLAGGVWTNDLHKAHGVAAAIEAGTVWVNAWLAINAEAPFGGYKASGMGREGGEEALSFYTQTKNVYVQMR